MHIPENIHTQQQTASIFLEISECSNPCAFQIPKPLTPPFQFFIIYFNPLEFPV